MRLVLLLMTALVAHLAAGASWARTPRACRPCHTVCGNAISECLAAALLSCPKAPRGNHRCMIRKKHHCRKVTTAHCITACKQTGSPVCGTTACAPYTSTCPAVSLTPVAVSTPFTDQLEYAFNARAASPGPGSCCVIDACAGITQFNPNGAGVSISYREIVFLDPFNYLPDKWHDYRGGGRYLRRWNTCECVQSERRLPRRLQRRPTLFPSSCTAGVERAVRRVGRRPLGLDRLV